MIAPNICPAAPPPLAGDFERAIMRTQRLLAPFDTISLAEMRNVSLLDRTDTKYVIGISQLYALLPQMADRYRALCVDRSCLNHYRTLYFDTRDFALYRQHHNGLSPRYKVRARQYTGSGLAFFEVKHKTNQNRTIKSRLQLPQMVTRINGLATEFVGIYTPFEAAALEPKLWNEYVRLTLVSSQRPERVTIDLNLEFSWGSAYSALPGIAVVEVKQAQFSQQSDFIQQMRRMGIRPVPFSKYCAGVYLLCHGVKTNNFKPRMRQVYKVMHTEAAYAPFH